MRYQKLQATKGMTLLEILLAMGILSLLSASIVWIFIHSLRDSAIIREQLVTVSEGRRVLQQVVDDVRRAESSSIGSYPIDTAATSTLIFYANIDTDNYRERVHFWLASTTLKKGIVKPGGNPLQYTLANEQIVDLAHNVKNTSTPLFSYFGQSYTGTGTSLPQPVTTTDVRMIRVQLQLERDPTQGPVPLHVESTVEVRNLKSN